jgi:MoxR-like ATPase
MKDFKRYSGTSEYIVSEDLQNDVNVSIALGRPLLIKGEPGTGKTLLARSVAQGLNQELLTWNIKSTTKAQDGLYIYDTVTLFLIGGKEGFVRIAIHLLYDRVSGCLQYDKDRITVLEQRAVFTHDPLIGLR